MKCSPGTQRHRGRANPYHRSTDRRCERAGGVRSTPIDLALGNALRVSVLPLVRPGPTRRPPMQPAPAFLRRHNIAANRGGARPFISITTLCLASGPNAVVEDQRRPCEPGKGIMTCDRFHVVGNVGVVLAFVLCSPALAQVTDPHKLLAEADRLAWLRVWTRAEPIYAQAREAFVRQRRQAERSLRRSQSTAWTAANAASPRSLRTSQRISR